MGFFFPAVLLAHVPFATFSRDGFRVVVSWLASYQKRLIFPPDREGICLFYVAPTVRLTLRHKEGRSQFLSPTPFSPYLSPVLPPKLYGQTTSRGRHFSPPRLTYVLEDPYFSRSLGPTSNESSSMFFFSSIPNDLSLSF